MVKFINIFKETKIFGRINKISVDLSIEFCVILSTKCFIDPTKEFVSFNPRGFAFLRFS